MNSQASRRWLNPVPTIVLAALGLCLSGCQTPDSTASDPGSKRSFEVTKTSFGKTVEGVGVDIYTLKNSHGMMARIMTYGATLTALHVPDRNGKLADVTLGFDNLEAYLKGHPFFGSTAGRVANRIAKGRFTLNNKTYTLAVNNGPNHLHGGVKGFDKRVWNASTRVSDAEVSVDLTYRSPDGEEGYPGNLDVKVSYTLTDKDELRIDYEAKTDADTPVNLTNHSYFNLAGPIGETMLGHELQIDADQYTPVDATSIPIGENKAVKGTVMDFTKPTVIGARINDVGGDPGGYDHNYVLNKPASGALTLAARVYEPKSGRVMEVLTTEPGVQLYTGNYLDGSLRGKSGQSYVKRYGFCLECQHYPDSINQPKFPSVVLKPGRTYRQTTVHRFSVRKG